MTAARMTAAQLRKLGIDVPAARKKTTRKAVPTAECGAVRCVTCDETFPTDAAENRHAADHPTHRRYEAVIEVA